MILEREFSHRTKVSQTEAKLRAIACWQSDSLFMPGQKRPATQDGKARLRAFSLLWLEPLVEDRLRGMMTSHQPGAILPRDAHQNGKSTRHLFG